MEFGRTMLAGAGGLVIGVLIGMAISASGRSALEAQLAERGEAAAGMAKLEAAVGAVETRVGELGGRLDGVEGRLAEFGESARARPREPRGPDRRGGSGGEGSADGSKGSARTSRGRRRRSGRAFRRRCRTASRGCSRGSSPRPEAAQGAAAVAAPSGGELVRVGETASFGSGTLRVFLSAFDEAAGRARVAINGAQTRALELAVPVAVGDCAVMLTGFAEGGARVAGECAAAAPQGSGEGTAIKVGGTGALADGKLRVFLSGTDAGGGTARVAVNGTETIELRMSEPVQAGGCDVTLTGIGGGGATIDAGC